MNQFPAFLDLSGRRVVIAGGGPEALRKARLLAASGARIAVVAPAIEAGLRAELASASFAERRPVAADFDGAAVAVIADADADEAVRLAALARAAGALVNVVDRPALSDFFVPAIIDRGDVVVAVATGGAAPVLAQRLRARIEALLPARLDALAAFARTLRGAVAEKLEPAARRAFWARLFDGPIAARVLAGDETGARAAAIAEINRPQTERQGVVHIVGAGPGDPELLTLKALRLLQDADVIVHDRLVSDAILALARRDAERLYVGKKKADHAVPQAEIEERLIALARAGKRVVRLKGGDPFIFGRGGEELAALQKAGVAAFVVPGVTAATGCAAATGLPLTLRGEAQALTFITGHAKGEAEPELDWAALARLGHTLVVYMGASKASAIAERLTFHGRSPATPVALIENGTRPDQRVFKGVLGDLAALVEAAAPEGPALLVIGEVAALADAGAARDIAARAERLAA